MKPADYPGQPENLWNIFYDFTQTPRPSKKEDKIRKYLLDLAQKQSLETKTDDVGNIVIFVPGKNGRENDEPLLIQNHIDMVTDSLNTIQIDFENDPLKLKIENGWLKAEGTTLGADNGIGCAAALATIFDDTIVHPPLELLFTVDEETGLNGALGLDTSMLSAKKMLNLDTEEWGSLYIGCAGGIDYELTKDFNLSEESADLPSFKISVAGFLGGHSGLDIHEQRGNALKFLSEILSELSLENDFHLCELRGGRAHNIIPRDAFAVISAQNDVSEALKKAAEKISHEWQSFLPQNDQNFHFDIERLDQVQAGLSLADTQSCLQILLLFPHGAHAYDLNAKEIVSMSNNMARVLMVRGKFYIQSSLRFFDREEVKSLERKLKALGKCYDLHVVANSEYPSWKPSADNPVLDQVKACYRELYGKDPIVTAIHAGLECGILRDKIGPLDVVSFGPTIEGAHSPDERVEIASVEKFWDLFRNVLAKI
ncbi:MAG: aminoacyl-histidine dipeptidase [Halobacteriovoraceae bacterium]|nr:aminoacyl-histidine dipeptidase [Halobacteriovoraceae bacterium]|tara:strand:- start:39625 stop:41076 length:1452 start_codon:yes stop_codon:yes gene_type:complete